MNEDGAVKNDCERNTTKRFIEKFKKEHPQLDDSEDAEYHEFRHEHGVLHQFRYLNNTPLNKSHPDVLFNVLEYRETSREGK